MPIIGLGLHVIVATEAVILLTARSLAGTSSSERARRVNAARTLSAQRT